MSDTCARCGKPIKGFHVYRVESGEYVHAECPVRPARRLVYVAGPYTSPDPVENTHRAAKVGMAIYEHTDDLVPFVPHLSLLWHMVCPRPAQFWYDIDLDQMAHCQAIVRLPGASTGADEEMRVAKLLGLDEIAFDDLPEAAKDAWLR